MRLHSDILTRQDICEATQSRGMRGVLAGMTEHGSRIRAHAFEVKLTGNSSRRPNNRGERPALDRALDRARRRHGDALDTFEVDAVDPRIRAAYGVRRVEITRTYPSGETFTRRGMVDMTTGWRPALILLARVDSMGSSDILDSRDRLVSIVNPEVVR